MSLIIEALKKAQRDREEGRLPEALNSRDAPLHRMRRVGPWAAAGVAVMLAGGGFATWWWGRGDSSQPASRQPAAMTRSAPTSGDSDRQQTPAPSSSGSVARSEEPAVPVKTYPTPPAKLQPPPAAGRPEESTAPAKTQSIPPAKLQPPPASVGTGEPAAPARTSSNPPAKLQPPPASGGVQDSTDRPKTSVVTKTPPVSGEPVMPVPPATKAVTPSPAPAPAPSVPDVPRPEPPRVESPRAPASPLLADAIAGMTLNAHIYSEAKEDRVVYIDGQRYIEGQRVNGRYLVEAITPQGVVLSYQGERDLLPLMSGPGQRP
jgi:general secretion pathway protein B